MTALWPAPPQLTPAKPSLGERTGGCRTKGNVNLWGLAPAPPPTREPLLRLRTLHAPINQAHVAGNATLQDLFSGPGRPLGVPCSHQAQGTMTLLLQQPG